MDLDQKLSEYLKAFGDGFPMYPLARGRSEKEVIELIDRCLKVKKDVYELGILQNPEETEDKY